jgi:site-specific DNA-methyltransferase (adenine-specific)
MEVARQINLFGEVEQESLSIEESAGRAGVSTATIRNWIKTGYLLSIGKGRVGLESFERFQSEVAGKEKLNKRANKSLKDDHVTLM